MEILTENLVKAYHGHRVVDEISVHVKRGEVVGLLGPNGAGKTTTFYMIVGLVKPNAGKVFLDKQEITYLPMHKRSHLGIGYLPQEPSIFRKLTVEENIRVLWELNPSIKPSEYHEKITQLLDELGVTRLRKQRAYTLSGGEQRRVEIARAMATNPSFLLLDEPFTGIDPKTVDDLQLIIRRLAEQHDLGVLITDHNVRETLEITDRAYIVHQGKILISGNSKEVSESKIAKKFYLGDTFSL